VLLAKIIRSIMKMNLSRVRRILSASTFAFVVAATSAASVSAAPISKQNPPTSPVSGVQSKPPVEPGKSDAKLSEKLGPTNEVSRNTSTLNTKATAMSAFVGNVSTLDFSTFYNYCYKNLVYTTIHNNTSSTQYAHLYLYNGSGAPTRDLYVTVGAGATVYPAFYGIEGAYQVYMYTWNGSSYAYDEYKTSTNTCNVSVTRTYNTGGWVQLKIQNLGTAYASQVSTELAPYPGSGTYTGTQYDYPTAGGAAIYRWFQVGTQPYGIVSTTANSHLYPALFYGDL
jgi:hypothetical protein